MDLGKKSDFEHFVAEVEPSLRRALVASYGFDLGREATANALGWAWEHRERLERIHNKVAYLYRVGQSSVRKRKAPVEFIPTHSDEPWFEPSLGPSLAALTDRQRTAVVLIYGFGWTLAEVAELTGTRISTIQSHLERGLHNLRIAMEVTDNA